MNKYTIGINNLSVNVTQIDAVKKNLLNINTI